MVDDVAAWAGGAVEPVARVLLLPVACTAAALKGAEVEEVVDDPALPPSAIPTPVPPCPKELRLPGVKGLSSPSTV